MSQQPVMIGRYRVIRPLGQGAMGMVYLAMDPLLKRQVAVKVVTAMGKDAEVALTRFQREAEITARLNHPNIVMVFDVGQDARLGPFMAMEYIEGTSMARLMRQGLSVESGMRLLAQCMAALQAAEAAGVIHRDIKPENTLVSVDGRLKLMDFGIAWTDKSQLTQDGMLVGTPSYTAPELLTGSEPSFVTDRYAFAVTAFEVVFGVQPFRGTSVGSTLYRIVNEPLVCPEGTPPYLAAVFTKALAKSPFERYSDLSSFMSALVEALVLPDETKVRLLAYLAGDQPFGATQGVGSERLQFVPVGDAPTGPMASASRTTDTFPGAAACTQTVPLAPTDTQPTAPGMSLVAQEPVLAVTAAVDPGMSPAPEPVSAQAEVAPICAETCPSGTSSTGMSSTGTSQTGMSQTGTSQTGMSQTGMSQTGMSQTGMSQTGTFSTASAEAEGPARVGQVPEVGFAAQPPDAQEVMDPLVPRPLPEPAPRAQASSRPQAAPRRRVMVWGGVALGLLLLAGGGTLLLQANQPSTAPVPETATEAPSVPTPAAATPTPAGASKAVSGPRIQVVTDPAGAEVLLNDQVVGRTPLVNLPIQGRPRLTLRLPGHEEWTTEVDPDLPLPDVIRLSPLKRPRRGRS